VRDGIDQAAVLDISLAAVSVIIDRKAASTNMLVVAAAVLEPRDQCRSAPVDHRILVAGLRAVVMFLLVQHTFCKSPVRA